MSSTAIWFFVGCNRISMSCLIHCWAYGEPGNAIAATSNVAAPIDHRLRVDQFFRLVFEPSIFL